MSRAKAAVVPSRWENFPNVCIEAMGSGLPVIATRSGGMAEIIEDERTGWLASDSPIAGMVDGLADALRRCLAASPEKRALMGKIASQAVGRLCDNERIVDEQIGFRADVRRRGAQRSLTVAALTHSIGREPARATGFMGKAGIIVSATTSADVEPVLRSIADQTRQATAVALVCGAASEQDKILMNRFAAQGVTVQVWPSSQRSEAWNVGYATIREQVASGFVLFLDVDDRLQPDCLQHMEHTLAHRPEVGLVATWIGRDGRIPLEAPLSPELSHQLMRNELGSIVAFRAEALQATPPFRALPSAYDLWQLSVSVLARGWVGVTFPALLAERRGSQETIPWPDITALRGFRAELLAAAADRIPPMALELLHDYAPLSFAEPRSDRSGVAQIMSILKKSARRKITRARARLVAPPTDNR